MVCSVVVITKVQIHFKDAEFRFSSYQKNNDSLLSQKRA